MPQIEVVEQFSCPPHLLFDLMRRPTILMTLVPPEFGLTLQEGPERLSEGDVYTVVAQRWGMKQTIVTAVVLCQPAERWVEEQRRGPLRRWRVERDYRPCDGGTELTERIDFEPPGGLLGLTLTASRIEADVRMGYNWRRLRLAEQIAAVE